MIIEHFGGRDECKTIEDLERILKMRYGNAVNEYWIYGEDTFPCLAVLVKDNCASLTYFPNDNHAGFCSITMDDNVDNDGTTIFYVNTPTEEIEVDNGCIVPFANALEAVKEFFVSLSKPSCLEWVEL